MNIAKRYEMVPLGEIVPYARNAKQHTQEQVAQIRASFREFGVITPCLVDEDYNLLAGHGRLLAAQQENLAEINCVIVEGLTEQQKKAFIITDNKIGENASWDNELLALEFGELKDFGFDLELTGFSLDEIEKLFSEDADGGEPGEAEEDDFDVDGELEKPAFSLPGDIWTLGRHRVICGDSTIPGAIADLMDGKKANLILTDPPYGVDYVGKSEQVHKDNTAKIKNDKFANDEVFYDFLIAAFTNMETHLANDGAAYIFHADTKGMLFRKAFDDAGFRLAGTCVWVKNTFVMGRCDYHWGHEPCLYGWKQKGKHVWYGDRKQSTVWHCDKPSRSEKHPTMKPLPLLATPILNSTQTNGIVLEPFGGSGSTLICCEQLGRICYASELDEKFVDVIVNRYIEAVGSADGVFVERDGETLPYAEVAGNG